MKLKYFLIVFLLTSTIAGFAVVYNPYPSTSSVTPSSTIVPNPIKLFTTVVTPSTTTAVPSSSQVPSSTVISSAMSTPSTNTVAPSSSTVSSSTNSTTPTTTNTIPTTSALTGMGNIASYTISAVTAITLALSGITTASSSMTTNVVPSTVPLTGTQSSPSIPTIISTPPEIKEPVTFLDGIPGVKVETVKTPSTTTVSNSTNIKLAIVTPSTLIVTPSSSTVSNSTSVKFFVVSTPSSDLVTSSSSVVSQTNSTQTSTTTNVVASTVTLDGRYSGASFSTTDVAASTVTLTGLYSGVPFTTTDVVASTKSLTGTASTITVPFITGIVADDPKLLPVANFDNSDTITVRFSEATNQPFKGTNNQLTKTNLLALFTFSQNLGTDYTGKWVTSSTLLITIQNKTGSTPPTIGGLILSLKESAGLKNAKGTSVVSNSISPPLSGSFGLFMVTIPPTVNDTVSTVLPSGTTTEVQLPPNTSGDVTITRSSLNSTGSKSVPLTFVGDVIDIDLPSPTTCSSGCDFRFIIDQGDLDNANVTLATLRIFHDKNGDGDAADSGEALVPTINYSLTTGPFTVSVKDTSTSNFAIGGVPASITMILHVINNDGGPASASDFTMSLVKSGQTWETFAGSAQGTPFGVNEGTYSITTPGRPAYSLASISGDGCPNNHGVGFSLSKGQGITCIITFDDFVPPCMPPASGNWTIDSSCILQNSATVNGNVIVQSGAVLTIPSNVFLDIKFTTNHLLVQSGGGVLIKADGKIF